MLTGGASAVYGADAVAGVVNFILRQDFRGFEVTGEGGGTTQGGASFRRASAIFGFGNLATDRYNVMATATASSKKLLAPMSAPGEATLCGTRNRR